MFQRFFKPSAATSSGRTLHRFPGGITPPECKTLSNRSAIRTLDAPPRLILSLHQHIGTPANPIVAAGEYVHEAGLLAVKDGERSANLHAPLAGKILEIADHPVAHPSGMSAKCIVLETQCEEQVTTKKDCRVDWLHQALGCELNAEALITLISDAGVVGMGGAGFPSHLKLRASIEIEKATDNLAIDTIILNGAECEPYITCDDLLMREEAEKILAGLALLHRLFPQSRCILALEDNKPDAIENLRKYQPLWRDFELVIVPTRYPSGGEKQLVQLVTGREVPDRGNPADVGAYCQNVATSLAIADAVLARQPLTSRVVTVTGRGVDRPGNYLCPIGTPIFYLLNSAGVNSQFQQLVLGGPMMGFQCNALDAGISKTTNCLIAGANDELLTSSPMREQVSAARPDRESNACIRCGYCVDVCPMGLLPQQLYHHAINDQFEHTVRLNLDACIDCGACAYVCPSELPLVQSYRYAKGAIREQEQQREKAEIARQRFEQRRLRKEREEAELAAKRKARAAARKKSGS